jgi:hypothetical protein
MIGLCYRSGAYGVLLVAIVNINGDLVSVHSLEALRGSCAPCWFPVFRSSRKSHLNMPCSANAKAAHRILEAAMITLHGQVRVVGHVGAAVGLKMRLLSGVRS